MHAPIINSHMRTENSGSLVNDPLEKAHARIERESLPTVLEKGGTPRRHARAQSRLRRLLLPLFLLGGIAAHAAQGEGRAFDVTELLALSRVSEAEVSPDGKWVAYCVRKASLEKNVVVGHIWMVPSSGGTPRQLTNHEKGESRPKWSPDSKTIAFLSSRSGTPQIWLIAVDGGEARQVTTLSTGADQHIWSPRGDRLAFASDVWPGLAGGDAAQKKKEEEIADSGIKATVIDQLLYRHWKEWRLGKRTHIFVVPIEGRDEPVDLTPGDADAPPFSLGGGQDFAISPDGKELVFTRGPISARTQRSQDLEAWSTDANLWSVPVGGGEPQNLTSSNPGWDGTPIWSPDGRYIAHRSQARDGYESDKFRLTVLERKTGKTRYLAEETDRSVEEILWAPDSRTIYFRSEDQASSSIFAIPFSGLEQVGKAEKRLVKTSFADLSMPASGQFLIGGFQSLIKPDEVARIDLPATATGSFSAVKPLTRLNEEALRSLALPSYESIEYPGADGAKIQAWLVKPPEYAPGRQYPLLLAIHGGPQSAWRDALSYRFSPAVFAARGYLVLMPNPRGSTGFGQAFTEQISGDWAGAVYTDLMLGLNWAIGQNLVDTNRMVAYGASFGGYMINWILGHRTDFKALVSHAGVYNLESMYGSTEELWFPEWDLGGTPWKNKGAYERFSPHRFAANFKTPTLVTHNAALRKEQCARNSLREFS